MEAYLETPVNKKASRSAVDKAIDQLFDGVPSYRIIWRLVKRHKFGLMTTYAILTSIVVFVPFLPGLIMHSLIQ